MIGVAMYTTILTLYRSGMKIRKISRTTSIHRDTVRKIIKRYEKEGFVCQSLYRYHAGTPMGTFKHNKLIPNHAFALSNRIKHTFPKLDLDKTTAISYLRKETLPVPEGKDQGWHLMCYQGLKLGWGKVLKDRINNYFPKHLRIRMQDN